MPHWAKKAKQYSTSDSREVTHRSTRLAQRCLTSLIGREGVCSPWYDRTMGARGLGELYISRVRALPTSRGGQTPCNMIRCPLSPGLGPRRANRRSGGPDLHRIACRTGRGCGPSCGQPLDPDCPVGQGAGPVATCGEGTQPKCRCTPFPHPGKGHRSTTPTTQSTAISEGPRLQRAVRPPPPPPNKRPIIGRPTAGAAFWGGPAGAPPPAWGPHARGRCVGPRAPSLSGHGVVGPWAGVSVCVCVGTTGQQPRWPRPLCALAVSVSVCPSVCVCPPAPLQAPSRTTCRYTAPLQMCGWGGGPGGVPRGSQCHQTCRSTLKAKGTPVEATWWPG